MKTHILGKATGKAAIALVALALLGACSSAGKASPGTSTSTGATADASASATTTTAAPPSADLKVKVLDYFRHDGLPILLMERLTAPLSTGSSPTKATCQRIATKDIPAAHLPTPLKLIEISKKVPDPVLAPLLKNAIEAKTLALNACVNLPFPMEAEQTVVRVERALERRMADYGLKTT